MGLLTMTLAHTCSIAQNVLDNYYIAENTLGRRLVPYAQIRQADVMWSKRIWQIIDLREKLNLPLYYPLDEIRNRSSLFNVIKVGLNEGSITAYDPGPLGDDDEFKVPMTISEIRELLYPEVTTTTIDVDTGLPIDVSQVDEIRSANILQYKIKEDWYFDKQRSQRYVRIIGIAPRIEVLGEDGEVRGMRDLFWLYFPECRYFFANWDAFNPHNDAERRTYEDIFIKRIFSSYIIKESNVYDRKISEYTTGIDHLLESERIKEEIFRFEHDLWSY